MYVRTRQWEAYAEKVPPTKKLIDWYCSVGENHIWVWRYHIVFNERYGVKHEGQIDGDVDRSLRRSEELGPGHANLSGPEPPVDSQV